MWTQIKAEEGLTVGAVLEIEDEEGLSVDAHARSDRKHRRVKNFGIGGTVNRTLAYHLP